MDFQWKYQTDYFAIRLRQYIKKYELFIRLVTVFGGFHVAVEICRSKLFYASIFGLSLTKKEIQALRSWKFVNVVLLEVCYFYLVLFCFLFREQIHAQNSSANPNISSATTMHGVTSCAQPNYGCMWCVA